MTGADDGWLNALIGLLQGAQVALLQALAALGLVEASHGQPGWPWALKLSGENLLIDGGQARRLAGSLAVLASVVVLLLLAMAWRRRRVAVLVAVPVLLLATPFGLSGACLFVCCSLSVGSVLRAVMPGYIDLITCIVFEFLWRDVVRCRARSYESRYDEEYMYTGSVAARLRITSRRRSSLQDFRTMSCLGNLG